MNCLLCQVDGAATDEQTYRACYYAAAQRQFVEPGSSMCEQHRDSIAFGARVVEALAGALPPPLALAAPPLRLVKR